MVILITGKKGAGKSHYARALVEELNDEAYSVRWLDGDRFRDATANQDYSDKGRERNLMSAARAAQEFEEMGNIVILSFVAPKKKWRDAMRKLWNESRIVYIPGGTLWEGTTYERPNEKEIKVRHNYKRKKSWQGLM